MERGAEQIAGQFLTEGKLIQAVPWGNGHINDTFLGICRSEEKKESRYIFQKINTYVFREPERLMENMEKVTRFLSERIREEGGSPEREGIILVPAADGGSYVRDSRSGFWRCMRYIEGSVSLDRAENGRQLYEMGRVLGRFQARMDAFPAAGLYETIPDFHHTGKRFEQLWEAVRQDRLGRKESVRKELQFAAEREREAGILLELARQGEIPVRVTHNDTKMNNVLLDEADGRGLCLVDLDTIMPGLVHYDYGDAVRSGAVKADEDEQDLGRVEFDLELFRSLTRGFLETALPVLREKEIRTLPWGAKLMTLECGIRFLTDYLEGDHYFKISRPGQNLDRARTQFKLTAGMERVWDEMEREMEQYKKE